MRTLHLVLVALLLAPGATRAHGGSHAPDPNLHVDPSVSDCEVRFAPELSQQAFRRFAHEFGSISSFKQASAPTTLGKWGVSFALERISFTVEEHAAAWNDTFTHPEATHELGSDKNFPKLKLRVGVGDHTDVGVYYTMAPESNYGWIGLDVKHALLRQDPNMPVTVAVRAAYTKTLFVDDMDMHTLSGDASVGRTFWKVLTPYVGVGADAVLARETSPVVALDTEVGLVPHAFAGVEVSFWHVSLGVEGHLATVPSWQAQLAAVF